MSEDANEGLFCKSGTHVDDLSAEEKQKVLMVIGKLADNYYVCLGNVKKFIGNSMLGEKTELSLKEVTMPLTETIKNETLKRLEVNKGLVSKDYLTAPIFKVILDLNNVILKDLSGLANDIRKGAYETKYDSLKVFNKIVDEFAITFDQALGSKVGRVLIVKAKAAA